MMDKITKDQRSLNMSKIKNKDTKPEMTVRKLLHKMGYRFRLHRKDLPGKPDIVLPRYKTVIFIHGCFWHHHPDCKYAYIPKSRIEFWNQKFIDNMDRDKKNQLELLKQGWNIGVIWECEICNINILLHRINQILIESNDIKNHSDV